MQPYEEAPAKVPGSWDHIWFLKEADKNFATGIVVAGSPAVGLALFHHVRVRTQNTSSR